MPFFLISPEEDTATASGKIFLKAKKAKTLLEEYLAM